MQAAVHLYTTYQVPFVPELMRAGSLKAIWNWEALCWLHAYWNVPLGKPIPLPPLGHDNAQHRLTESDDTERWYRLFDLRDATSSDGLRSYSLGANRNSGRRARREAILDLVRRGLLRYYFSSDPRGRAVPRSLAKGQHLPERLLCFCVDADPKALADSAGPRDRTLRYWVESVAGRWAPAGAELLAALGIAPDHLPPWPSGQEHIALRARAIAPRLAVPRPATPGWALGVMHTSMYQRTPATALYACLAKLAYTSRSTSPSRADLLQSYAALQRSENRRNAEPALYYLLDQGLVIEQNGGLRLNSDLPANRPEPAMQRPRPVPPPDPWDSLFVEFPALEGIRTLAAGAPRPWRPGERRNAVVRIRQFLRQGNSPERITQRVSGLSKMLQRPHVKVATFFDAVEESLLADTRKQLAFRPVWLGQTNDPEVNLMLNDEIAKILADPRGRLALEGKKNPHVMIRIGLECLDAQGNPLVLRWTWAAGTILADDEELRQVLANYATREPLRRHLSLKLRRIDTSSESRTRIELKLLRILPG